MEDQDKRQNFWYIAKKTEKLVTAVYMLTDFLSDTEPMKSRLRTAGTALLSDTHSLERLDVSERKVAAMKAIEDLESILSFLEVAAHASLISPKNVQILRDEFLALKNILHDRIAVPVESISFRQEFFALPPRTRQEGRQDEENSSESERRDFSIRQNVGYIRDIKKDKVNLKSDISEINRGAKPEVTLRQRDLLYFIKDKKIISIKDAIVKFPNIGEKTIQRDLIALIQKGAVLRTGERRWSRYSPAM